MISRQKVLLASWDVWRTKRAGTPAILATQQKRFQSLLEFTRLHSRFYQRLYQHLPQHITQLTDLPPVTKGDLMQHFDEWVTDPQVRHNEVNTFIADMALIGVPYLGRYAVWRTSGTTGSPGIFLHDADALATYIALLITRCYLSWTTVDNFWRMIQQRWRTAFVFATSGHFASNTFETVTHQLRPGSSETPPIFSAHMALSDLVDALNARHPAILATYPSVLATLTREQASGRLKIKPILIATGGECLKPFVKQQAIEVFQCNVHDAYAASEFMGIAFDCPHGRLHVNSDCVILEPVDADYQPLAPGSPPHTVLLTNLVNRVQPIIRYEMGDSVSFDTHPCRCGNPLPTIVVEGRDDEILSFATPMGKYVDILPLPLATVVMVIPGVQRFQLIQTGAKVLKVRLEMMPDTDTAQVWQVVVDHLREYFNSHGLSSVEIECSNEPPLRQTVSGKFRHVWSEWHSY
jgi:phenylacetate-CoA ligase